MNTQQKIDAIYEVIADKTISFGCKVKKGVFHDMVVVGKVFNYDNGTEDIKKRIQCAYYYWVDTEESFAEGHFKTKELEVVWHPVMIGDVLDWISKNYELEFDYWDWPPYDNSHTEIYKKIIYYWGDLRKPIEDQSEECIDYIYSLIGIKND